jgi:RNA-directed DNA polymerase
MQRKIRETIRTSKGASQVTLIRKLNPILRGWGNYFSTVVSKDIFGKMDMHIFQKLWAWSCRRHPNKTRHWVARKYWQRGYGGWLFRCKKGYRLVKLLEIPIRRHVKVKGQRSPYDDDIVYWSTRMGKHPQIPSRIAKLLKAQKGICPCCGLFFKSGDSFAITRHERKLKESSESAVLIHEYCCKYVRAVVWNDNPPFF